MEPLSDIQVRVLGCLAEKQRTTPDQYPLTLNALRNACNQKSARFPVTAYTEGEVGHAVRELEALKLVREEWGARAPKYEHRLDKDLGLYRKGFAVLTTLMLRGPQTLGEIRTHAHRLFEFDDLDDVHYELEKLAAHEPPLVTALPRQPGQKEGRYAHLLAGEPVVPEPVARPTHTTAPAAAGSALEQRIDRLEAELIELRQRLEQLENDA